MVSVIILHQYYEIVLGPRQADAPRETRRKSPNFHDQKGANVVSLTLVRRVVGNFITAIVGIHIHNIVASFPARGLEKINNMMNN